jgi:hypothetical protein
LQKSFPPGPFSKNSKYSFLVPGLCLGMHGRRLRLPDSERRGMAREAFTGGARETRGFPGRAWESESITTEMAGRVTGRHHTIVGVGVPALLGRVA